MRVWSTMDLFKEPWEKVSYAHWIKYPNPLSSHVLTADTLERRVDPETGYMHSTRLMMKTNRKPEWIRRLVGSDSHAFVVEESVLDPRARTLTTFTKNITLNRWMTVEETCVYQASSDNPDWTSCKTTARVTSPISLGAMVERFGIERFKSNSQRAKQAVLYALDRVRPVSYAEGRDGPAAPAVPPAPAAVPASPS